MVIRTPQLFFITMALAAPALAENEQLTNTEFNTVISEVCLFSSVDAQSSVPANVSETEDGLLISFEEVVDPNTAELRPFALNISLIATCNFKHQVVVRSLNGGLLNEQTSSEEGGFSNRADYSVNASWANETANFQTSGAAGEGIGIDVSGGYSGRMDINLGSSTNSLPLISGDYSDAILIEISNSL